MAVQCSGNGHADRGHRAQAVRRGQLVDEAGRRSVEHGEVDGLVHLGPQLLEHGPEVVAQRLAGGGAEARQAAAEADASAGVGADEVLVGQRAHQPVDGGLREVHRRGQRAQGQTLGRQFSSARSTRPARAID